MLNNPRFAKNECSLFARTKKFMDEYNVIIERVFQVMTDHLRAQILSVTYSLFDFSFDGGGFQVIILLVQLFYYFGF